MIRTALFIPLLALLGALVLPGCTPGRSTAGGRGKITQEAVHSYLSRREVARSDVVRDVTKSLHDGKRYRKRVLDQNKKWTLLTVYLNKDFQDMLVVVTKRSEPCPECGGLGTRDMNLKNFKVKGVAFACRKCKGEKFLDDYLTTSKYLLNEGDYENGDELRRINRAQAYTDAPAQTEQYVQKLASEDPKERLAACLWLDKNYVREGDFFHRYNTMLDKARWRETNPDKTIMAFQWWAGKGLKSESHRAYYRIYVDAEAGTIKEKGFYPEAP